MTYDDIKRDSKGKHYVERYGLQWRVLRKIYGPMVPAVVEDSRWESEEKANEHCRLLNEQYPE